MEHKCIKTEPKTIEKCKLNAEQIIKALECCTRGRKSKDDRPCLDCPYNECNLVGGTSERQTTGTCQGWLMKDALALITSQEQRIEAYRQELGEVRVALAEANNDKKKLADENERLRAEQSKIKRKVLMEAASKFAGHSDYHGDTILCKLICMSEGKEVGIANPIDEIRKKETQIDTVRKMHSMLCEGRVSNDNVVIVANQIKKVMLESANG